MNIKDIEQKIIEFKTDLDLTVDSFENSIDNIEDIDACDFYDLTDLKNFLNSEGVPKIRASLSELKKNISNLEKLIFDIDFNKHFNKDLV